MILEMALIISNMWAVGASVADHKDRSWCCMMCVAWALVGVMAAVLR